MIYLANYDDEIKIIPKEDMKELTIYKVWDTTEHKYIGDSFIPEKAREIIENAYGWEISYYNTRPHPLNPNRLIIRSGLHDLEFYEIHLEKKEWNLPLTSLC